MVTVVKGTPNFGTTFGTGISQGLGVRLNQLAEHKAKELQMRTLATAIQGALSGQQQEAGQQPLADRMQPGDQQAPQPGQQQTQNPYLNTFVNAGGDLQVAKAINDAVDKYQQQQFRQSESKRKENQFLLTQQQPAFEEARKSAEAAKENIRDANSIIAAARSGDLQSGAWNTFFERFGLEELWRNPTTQLAAKAINRNARNAVAGMGGRPSDERTKLYQRGFATLNNTPDVIAVIAENAKLWDEIKVAKEGLIQELLERGESRNVIGKADRILEPAYKRAEEQERLNIDNAIKNAKKSKKSNKGFDPFEKKRFDIGSSVSRDAVTSLPIGSVVERGGKQYIVTEDGLKAQG